MLKNLLTNINTYLLYKHMNEHIIKLNKHIANAWESLEKAVNSKNRVAAQDALNKLAHLENLKEQQLALDQSIAASISAEQPAKIASSITKHQNGSSHPLSAEPVYFSTRRKRQTIRPQEIRIGSYRKAIGMANQIPTTVANWLLEQGKTLPTIQNFVHPSNSGFSQSASTKQLINGTFIEIGDNQEVLIQKARRLLDACGYRNLKFEILFEDGNSKTC
jgi:hypothetical protein